MEICAPSQPPIESVKDKIEKLRNVNKADFDEWTSLIAEIEKTSPVNIENISLVYDSFLAEFPLCYGYWRKYAAHTARLGTLDKVVEVYERAVQSATYCVDLWVDYSSFGMLLFEDPVNVQRLFERGISYVGKDYLCNLLWDKYIEFEYSQKQWSSVAHIYIRALKYPTKKLGSYYDSFKKLVAMWEEEITSQNNNAAEGQLDTATDNGTTRAKVYNKKDITIVIKDLLDPTAGLSRRNALQKYLSTGEKFYREASELDAKIRSFESHIRRPYFHVKPLDICQLEIWHQYLDFAELHGDFDWTVKLYERCLIPCANYPEFWMRYTEFMELKGGREIANSALIRGTQIFLKRVPAIHTFCARLKEKIGDAFGSRAAYRQCDNSEFDSDIIENVKSEANMEKRLGNFEAGMHIYEEALQRAIEKQKYHIFSMLSVHFFRYKYMVTGDVEASREILIKGIQHSPQSKLLLQEILTFEMMHRGPKPIKVVDSFVTQAICPGPEVSQSLSTNDREDISTQYLEFLDHCGTINDFMKAWNRHRRMFPHLVRPTSFDHRTGQDIISQLPHASDSEKVRDSLQALQLDNKSSLPEDPDREPDHVPTTETQIVDTDSTNERLQVVSSPMVVEQSGQATNKHNAEANEMVDEISLVASQEYSEGANKVHRKSDPNCNDDSRLPSLASLSLNPRNIETHDSIPTTSHGRVTLQETPSSNRNRQHDEISLSSLTCPKCGSKVRVHPDYGRGHMPSNNQSSLEVNRHSQPLPHTNRAPNRIVNTKNRYRPPNYSESQHPKRLQQYPPSSAHPQALGNQNFPHQPQTWQTPPLQPNNPAANQYQVPAVQMPQMSSNQWAGQTMQPQYFAPNPQPPQLQPVVSQSVAYPQAQAYQYPVQNNVQYAYMQGNQVLTPEMWHYYYGQQQQQPQLVQQFATVQTQPWDNSYYQQQAVVQQYAINPFGQEYVQQAVQSQGQGTTPQNMSIMQGQGTTPQNIEASGPPLPLYPEIPQPPAPHDESTQYGQEYGQQALQSHEERTSLQNIEASGSSVPLYRETHHPPVPNKDSSQYGQQYGQHALHSHEQETTPQNIESSGPSAPSYPENQQPPAPQLESSQCQPKEYGEQALQSHGKETTEPNIKLSGLSLSPCPKQQQSPMPMEMESQVQGMVGQCTEASEPFMSLSPQKDRAPVQCSGQEDGQQADESQGHETTEQHMEVSRGSDPPCPKLKQSPSSNTDPA
ncbi:hypothetical protein ACHQM5_004605 [Ranunculus cassubicifolius]